jgi:translocation and assembly module TamB
MDDTTTPPPPPRPRRTGWQHAARLASMVAAALLVVGALGAAVLGTLWRSEGGTRWLLQHLPGVTAVDVQGSLGGGDLRVGSLRALAGSLQVDAHALHVSGLHLHWLPYAGAWLRVTADTLEADTLHLTPLLAKPATGTSAAPASLRSPVALDVARLRIGSFGYADVAPLRDVQAALSLGAEDGALHRVDGLRFGWERVAGEASAQLRTEGTHELAVTLAAHDTVDPAAGQRACRTGPPAPRCAARWPASTPACSCRARRCPGARRRACRRAPA